MGKEWHAPKVFQCYSWIVIELYQGKAGALAILYFEETKLVKGEINSPGKPMGLAKGPMGWGPTNAAVLGGGCLNNPLGGGILGW